MAWIIPGSSWLLLARRLPRAACDLTCHAASRVFHDQLQRVWIQTSTDALADVVAALVANELGVDVPDLSANLQIGL